MLKLENNYMKLMEDMHLQAGQWFAKYTFVYFYITDSPLLWSLVEAAERTIKVMIEAIHRIPTILQNILDQNIQYIFK